MIKRFLQANLVWEIGQLALAVFLASLGLKAFLLPNGFLDGGVTGISILLSKITWIEISIILPVISIPFFVIGWFTISRKTVIRSISQYLYFPSSFFRELSIHYRR
ncbi:YitT family protein [Christiangramia portivictoriae]|uniref:YitT family protein n=1 Tax=Christiangramia portivictoriae TaxID=326069 RepID=UPI0021CD56F3|nr:YitT family protein [Christiangramia portivictoriae]